MSVLFNRRLRLAGLFFKLNSTLLQRLLLSNKKFILSKSNLIISAEHPTASRLVSSAKLKFQHFHRLKEDRLYK